MSAAWRPIDQVVAPGAAPTTSAQQTLREVDVSSADLSPDLLDRVVPILALAVSSACVVVGSFSLSLNSLDPLRAVIFAALFGALALLGLHAKRETGEIERGIIVMAIASLVSGVVLLIVPEYTYGHQINGVIHRSLLTAILMLAIGLPAMCTSLYYVLGATPTAYDRSRYPLILYPILLVMSVYGALLWRLIADGAPDLSWTIISRPYDVHLTGTSFDRQAGMLNQVLGTLLLIGMTSAISLPIGMGAGICMSEYEGWIANIVGFSTLMLRAMSVFILGVTVYSLVQYAQGYPAGNWISDLIRGYYYDVDGFQHSGHGSFLVVSVVLSLLVIPVIARATEEGFRSVPREIREGSLALGASEGHGFLHILLPWSLPNVITGLLLGCAEAAGSVAILLFVAGTGEFGVGPLKEVTSLAFLVFYTVRGTKSFTDVMGQYEFSAALLLLMITFTLSIAALVLKQRFGKRYRGGASF